MKHLKLFNDNASYEAWKNSEDYVLPNVSYTEDGNLYYNAYAESASPNLVVVYNVVDLEERQLLTNYAEINIVSMIVDGVAMEYDQYYKFDNIGTHTVEFVLDDNTYIPEQTFNGISSYYRSFDILSISLPSTITKIESNNFIISPEIICHAKTAPIFESYAILNGSEGVLKYPKGSDYSSVFEYLESEGSNWTGVEF